MPVSAASAPYAKRPLIRLDALPPMPKAILACVPVGSTFLPEAAAFVRGAQRVAAETRADEGAFVLAAKRLIAQMRR